MYPPVVSIEETNAREVADAIAFPSGLENGVTYYVHNESGGYGAPKTVKIVHIYDGGMRQGAFPGFETADVCVERLTDDRYVINYLAKAASGVRQLLSDPRETLQRYRFDRQSMQLSVEAGEASVAVA